jgi:phosphatidylserine decarboxylase
MYHRFHAPSDLTVHRVTYISGDTWNVNPIALKRVEKLFCKNERAVINARLEPSGQLILLVPVAAILVASIRLHFIDTQRHLRELAAAGGIGRRIPRNRAGSRARDAMHHISCHCGMSKGQEMGWFEHGSTIIVFTPDGFNLIDGVREGTRIKAGQALMQIPLASPGDGPIDNSPVVAARSSRSS